MNKQLCDTLVKAMPSAPVTAKMCDSLVPGMPMRQPFVVVKECTIEQARQQGFTGTPERWEEIKRGYAQDMVRHHGLGTSVDFTNILFDGIGMQDSDGNWHHFPKQ